MASPAELSFDIVIIGSGPAGEGAAMQAAKQGKSVAVVERHDRLGGSCVHRGTIPSKSLRYMIFRMTDTNNNPVFRAAGSALKLSFPELRKAAGSVIQRQVDMKTSYFERNNVATFRGHARLLADHRIEVEEPTGGRRILQASAIVIATGSRPYRPPDIDFQHPRIFDSDTILDLDFTPQSITVYGAGVIGCEYTSMFRNLNSKVNLINTRAKLLEFLDDEIIDALAYHMRDRGILLRHNETYDKVTGVDDGAVLSLQSGKQLKTDVLLWANGRSGNTQDLGLETVGLQPNNRGQLDVNDDFQTARPHIYAVGDVIGFPSLASAAYVQGRYAAGHFFGGEVQRAMVREVPTGIYTSPEISSVGRTERELTEAKVPYEIGHAQFKNLARAQITGQTVGMLKLLFHRETLEVLGVHCFGANAAEIIHIGQAILSQQRPANSLLYFIHTTFNYPTMAEAYRVAALNGYNRLF
ncbi:MAG: Si-specific NAD(P)(+) transhydrogenase [Pirellulales bacterium]